jgi:hypothetical protein
VVRIRACDGTCFCGLITFRPAHSLPIPRLAHASRSWCATRVRCEMRDLRCTNARAQERRGVSPPWFRKCTCRNTAAKSRETAIAVLTNAGAVAVANPRGADAPRSCVGVRTSAGEIATFAMHKRTCTRAAGVSPPWFRKCTSRNAAAKSPETAVGVLTNAGAIAVANPRGADAPRS